MKPRLATVCLIAAGLGLVAGDRSSGAGLVIYKDYSFDADSQAEATEYSTDDHYSTVDNIVTPSGERLRILASQDPVFIPRPGGSSVSPSAMGQTIQAAEKRFPQFTTRLEPYRRAWAATPASTPAPPTPPSLSPASSPVADLPITPAPNHGVINNVLHTKSGETLRSWSVTGMEGDNVVISHADGISRIPITDLPDNLYGFPETVIDRAEQLRIAHQTQLTAAASTAQRQKSAKHNPHGHKETLQPWDQY